MARRKHTAEEIINKLREAEVAISQGLSVAEASRRLGITQQTLYRWRTEYGGASGWIKPEDSSRWRQRTAV